MITSGSIYSYSSINNRKFRFCQEVLPEKKIGKGREDIFRIKRSRFFTPAGVQHVPHYVRHVGDHYRESRSSGCGRFIRKLSTKLCNLDGKSNFNG